MAPAPRRITASPPPHVDGAVKPDVPSLIVVPIDYSIDVAKGLIGLGTETVAT